MRLHLRRLLKTFSLPEAPFTGFENLESANIVFSCSIKLHRKDRQATLVDVLTKCMEKIVVPAASDMTYFTSWVSETSKH